MKISTVVEDFVASVDDLELWKELGGSDQGVLRQAWEQYPVLTCRRQALSEAELTEFSRHFGPLEVVVKTKLQPGGASEVSYVTNLKGADGEPLGGLSYGEVEWHTDQAYRLKPATGAVLYGAEVPPDAGYTYFSNLYWAWEALPQSLKQAVEGREGVYSYHQRMYVGMREAFLRDKPFTADLLKETPDVVHPLVLTHPTTGRKSLYFDASTLTGIIGLSERESAELVAEVSPYTARRELAYRHAWQPGDVVMWDNGCLLHRRDAFDPALRRLMKRTTIHLPPARHCVPAGRVHDVTAVG